MVRKDFVVVPGQLYGNTIYSGGRTYEVLGWFELPIYGFFCISTDVDEHGYHTLLRKVNLFKSKCIDDLERVKDEIALENRIKRIKFNR